MGTRKEGFKKRTVAGKYRRYGIVGSYFGWTFEFRKHNVFCCSVNLLSTFLVKQPLEAHVPLFRPLSFVRVSLQAALSTHINSAMYSQKGCVVQEWLILQKRESIFKKSLLPAPRRLQRMLLQLLRYSLNIVYKPGKELFIADTLSRAFLPNKPSAKEL